jgi:hypothetical protein
VYRASDDREKRRKGKDVEGEEKFWRNLSSFSTRKKTQSRWMMRDAYFPDIS